MKIFTYTKHNNHQIENFVDTNREIYIQTTKSNHNKLSHFQRKEKTQKEVIKQEERLFGEEDIKVMIECKKRRDFK